MKFQNLRGGRVVLKDIKVVNKTKNLWKPGSPGPANFAKPPGEQDEFVLCLYEKILSCLPAQFCCFDSC